jgi:lysozyme
MTTPRLVKAIEAEEGRRHHAYPDPKSPLGLACEKAGIDGTSFRQIPGWERMSAAPWTIGVGQTGTGPDGRPIGPDTVWTDAQIDAARDASISRAKAELDHFMPWWKSMCDARQDVLVQMIFQMGLRKLQAFHRTLGCMADHEYEAAAAGMRQSLWAQQTPARAERLARIMESGRYPD